MKGIVLAGGAGTRLYPVTKVYSKQLTLIYDKPLVYYPLSILMLAGIKEILIISDKETIPLYKKLFDDGSQLGMQINYAVQKAPNGIAEAFIIGEKFIGKDNVTLILGDNIFYGNLSFLYNGINNNKDATIFGYQVRDPQRYGVIEFDKEGKAISIEEKPKNPKSHYAVTGLYFYDNDVVEIAASLKPSARGELEITDVNKAYLEKDKLDVQMMGRGMAWLDTGTHDSLLEASTFIETIEKRQGLMVACLEEIAYRSKFIDINQLQKLASRLGTSKYGQYLERLIREESKP